MKLQSVLFLLSFLFLFTSAQKNLPSIEVVTEGAKTSLRGLSVVSDKIVWVSGSNGTVGKTTDGGKTWKWMMVKGFEKRDFRDIEAFDAATAVVIAVDTPAYILKTYDSGESWKLVYENKKPGMFLDALEFWNDDAGIVLGDPVNQKIFIARTFDGGSTWKEIPERYKPNADSGEAFFAASGTNIRVLDTDEAVFVSGGVRSRIFIRDQVMELPVIQGKESTGANSIAVFDDHKRKGGTIMTVVGGDFSRPSSDSLNCFFSKDRGKTWTRPQKPPQGYRSCVEYLSKTHLITSGSNGVDFSFDGGNTWQNISKEGFHVCGRAKNGTAVFLAGTNGKIGRLHLE